MAVFTLVKKTLKKTQKKNSEINTEKIRRNFGIRKKTPKITPNKNAKNLGVISNCSSGGDIGIVSV